MSWVRFRRIQLRRSEIKFLSGAGLRLVEKIAFTLGYMGYGLNRVDVRGLRGMVTYDTSYLSA